MSEIESPSSDHVLDAIWAEAIEEFQEKTGLGEDNLLAEFSTTDAEDWTATFKEKFHKEDKLARISRVVSNNLDGIQNSAAAIGSACELTTLVCLRMSA